MTSWRLAHEPVDEQADDCLGAAVAAGRHGKPGRRENGDAQALAAVLAADQILRPPAHDIERAHRRQVALSHLLHTYNPSMGPGRDLSLHPTRSSTRSVRKAPSRLDAGAPPELSVTRARSGEMGPADLSPNRGG